MNPATDPELKAMRDAVYQHTISLEDWAKIRDNWRRDETWLTQEYNRMKACQPKKVGAG